MGVEVAGPDRWPQRCDWRQSHTWLSALLHSGAALLPEVPTDPDHRGMHRIATLLGAPSQRAVTPKAGLDEGRGVQSVRALPTPVHDRFGSKLRSSSSAAFALHTDEAFLETPCRWVLLHCWRPDPAQQGASLLADLCVLNSPELRSVSQRKFPYPCGPHATCPSDAPWRFNRDLLAPDALAPEVQSAVADLAATLTQHQVRFLLQPGELLLIDNWRIAHGREAFAPDSPRLLKRLRLL